MSKKQIRSPKEAPKKKDEIVFDETEHRFSKKTIIALICIACVVVIAAGTFLTVTLINRFAPVTSDKHSLVNALPEKIVGSVAFKDGGIYLCTDNEQILVDDNVYDPNDKESLNSVTYLWDCKDGTLIYLSDPYGDKKLIQYDPSQNKSRVLCSNVDSWRISPDRSKVAIVTDADQSGAGGMLLLFENGELSLLESGTARCESFFFTDDSSSLFALVGNTSPASLYMYKNGDRTKLQSKTFALGWMAPDGNSYLTVDVANTAAYVYNYTLHTLTGKSKEFANVTYSEVSPDGSVMYILHDYDDTLQNCTLTAVDTVTLKSHTVAQKVYTLNPTAVTDSAAGMVYAVESSVEDRYDIYFFDVSACKSIPLAKSAYYSSISNISINSRTKQGYMLLFGNNSQNFQLFKTDLSSGNAITEQIYIKNGKVPLSTVHEILYYEACDKLVLSANANKTDVEIYMTDGKDHEKLINSCGAIYDSSSGQYYSCSMLTNDAKYLVYLKDVVVISETDGDKFADHGNADIYGTLVVYNVETAKYSIVSSDVFADTFDCIQVQGDGESIYFSTLNQDGTFNLYHYNAKTEAKTLLLEGIDAMASYS